MNLESHFNEYRRQVRNEVFSECIDYAKAVPTARPQDFATAYNFISYALGAAKKAVTDTDEAAYKKHLTQHQLAITALHERMVAEVLEGYEGLTEEKLIQFIGIYGWQWFKFCEKSLQLKLNIGTELNPVVTWIPRYDAKFSYFWKRKGFAVFDSRELEIITAAKGSPKESIHAMLRFKIANPGQKILANKDGVFSYKPVDKLNREGEVDDWSLPLFSYS